MEDRKKLSFKDMKIEEMRKNILSIFDVPYSILGKNISIDHDLLRLAIQQMTRHSPLYKLLKAELTALGHWKNLPRGKPGFHKKEDPWFGKHFIHAMNNPELLKDNCLIVNPNKTEV